MAKLHLDILHLIAGYSRPRDVRGLSRTSWPVYHTVIRQLHIREVLQPAGPWEFPEYPFEDEPHHKSPRIILQSLCRLSGLHAAIVKRDAALVERLINMAVLHNPEYLEPSWPKNPRPLEVAIALGVLPITKLLVASGARLDVNSGITARTLLYLRDGDSPGKAEDGGRDEANSPGPISLFNPRDGPDETGAVAWPNDSVAAEDDSQDYRHVRWVNDRWYANVLYDFGYQTSMANFAIRSGQPETLRWLLQQEQRRQPATRAEREAACEAAREKGFEISEPVDIAALWVPVAQFATCHLGSGVQRGMLPPGRESAAKAVSMIRVLAEAPINEMDTDAERMDGRSVHYLLYHAYTQFQPYLDGSVVDGARPAHAPPLEACILALLRHGADPYLRDSIPHQQHGTVWDEQNMRLVIGCWPMWTEPVELLRLCIEGPRGSNMVARRWISRLEKRQDTAYAAASAHSGSSKPCTWCGFNTKEPKGRHGAVQVLDYICDYAAREAPDLAIPTLQAARQVLVNSRVLDPSPPRASRRPQNQDGSDRPPSNRLRRRNGVPTPVPHPKRWRPPGRSDYPRPSR